MKFYEKLIDIILSILRSCPLLCYSHWHPISQVFLPKPDYVFSDMIQGQKKQGNVECALFLLLKSNQTLNQILTMKQPNSYEKTQLKLMYKDTLKYNLRYSHCYAISIN